MVCLSFMAGFSQCTTASQVESTKSDRLVSALVLDCITCLTTQRILFQCEQTITFSHMFEFYHVSTCFIPLFHLFAIPPSQCTPAGSAQRSTITDCITCLSLQTFLFWLYVIIMSRTRFRVNLHSIVAWMSRKSLLETGAIFEVYVNSTFIEI